MNRPFALALLLTFGMNSYAQKAAEPTIPPAVKAAFTKQFPKAEQAKWEMEDGKDYEVGFKQAGTKWSATYDASANWLETEHEVAATALPSAVTEAITGGYSGHKLKESEMVETPSGTSYEVELENGKETLEVMFSADGKMLKSKAEEDGEGEEEED